MIKKIDKSNRRIDRDAEINCNLGYCDICAEKGYYDG